MNRKTASLAYPTNPLAAMRDLQDLDAVERPVNPATSSAESSEVARKPSNERLSVGESAGSGAESQAEAFTEAKKPTPKRSSRVRESDSASDEASPNAIADAVYTMLQKPYTADSRKGPFTVSTVKIPTEVWERLGWVATLTGQAKQEIITDALKTHFEKVLKSWK